MFLRVLTEGASEENTLKGALHIFQRRARFQERVGFSFPEIGG